MLYEELSAEVGRLGFCDIETNDTGLLTASNLALREIYSRLSLSRTARLAARGIKPILYHKQLTGKNGEAIEIELNGSAYSFRIHGSCQFAIMKGTSYNLTSVESTHEARQFKGITSIGSKIRFFGNFTYTIYDFSVYEDVLSLSEADIPDAGASARFNMRELYPDFMSFLSPATDTDGNPLKNCRLGDGVVEISSDYTGEILLPYRYMPEALNGEHDQIIDLPGEYTHLLPLLVASYYLLDKKESLARYYKARYDENIALLTEKGYNRIDTTYVNLNGWA